MTLRSALAAAVVTAALAVPAHAAPRQWTLDDILSLRGVSDPQISPDGHRIAYVVQELKPDGSEYQTDIWLADAETGASRRIVDSPVADESPRWSPDGRTLAFLSDRPRPGAPPAADGPDEGKRQIWLLPLAGGEAQILTAAPGGVTQFEWSKDGRFVAYLSHEPRSEERRKREKEKDDAWTPSMNYPWSRLWTVDVADHKAKQLTSGAFDVTSFAIAPDGRTICVAAQPTPLLPDMFHADLYTVPVAGGRPAPLVQQKGADGDPAYSPDGRWIAFVSEDGRSDEWWANNFVCIVPAGGGKPVNLTAGFDERIGGLLGDRAPEWSADGASILFAANWRTASHLYRCFTDRRPVEQLTTDVSVDGGATLAADGAIAFLREDPEHPREVWVRDPAGHARRLTDTNPQVQGLPVFPKQLVTWQAPDGRTIEGLLISPLSARQGVRAPLILNVHGGPAGAHEVTYSAGSKAYPWPLFAQQGFAVLMPNPRGSGGYGQAFRSANLRDWGGRDYEDLMSGVDALVKLGLVDEGRMAVCGWSYGGYMTSTIVTKTNRFRAAVVGAGVTDLGSMVGTCDIPDFNRSYFQAWPWEDPQFYVDHSALYHAGNVRTPTLFVHGGADERVPTSQGWEFYTALMKRGVPTDLLILPREPHGPREPHHLRSVMQWHLDWIDRYALNAPRIPKPRAQPAATLGASR